jgi:hypothetical protein
MNEQNDPHQPGEAPSPPEPTVETAEESTVETTGDERVDQALTRLTELDNRDVSDHAAVVEDVHRSLQDALAEEEG